LDYGPEPPRKQSSCEAIRCYGIPATHGETTGRSTETETDKETNRPTEEEPRQIIRLLLWQVITFCGARQQWLTSIFYFLSVTYMHLYALTLYYIYIIYECMLILYTRKSCFYEFFCTYSLIPSNCFVFFHYDL